MPRHERGREREGFAAPAPASRGDARATTALVLIGGGGHAQVVLSAALANCMAIAGFVDNNTDAPLSRTRGTARVGTLSEFTPTSAGCILSMGDLAARRVLIARLGEQLTKHARTIIHPSAMIDPSARIGRGVYVGPNAVVHACAIVRDHAIINTGAIIEHDCEIGENAHIAPGTILAGTVKVGIDTLLGIGCRVIPGITIGARVIAGAGSVIVRNVADGLKVKGVPAR